MDNGKPFQQSNSSNSPSFTPDARNTDPFVIDDLFDLSNDGNMVAADGGGFTAETAGAASTTAADNVDFCNFAPEPNYAGSFMDSDELCIPYADAAELEWISSITEDSFSNEEFEQLQLIQGLKSSSSSSSSSLTSLSHSAQPGTNFQQYYHFQPEPTRTSNPALRPEVSVPGKARSKRSRVAPENWTSRLRAVSKDDVFVPSAASSTSPEPEVVAVRKPVSKPKKIPENSEGRKCLHCSTDRTPQWRTGPMGPKTLCNACGVRYKSGRLVPEYRPAASPTFALSKHSNSHRKVMELRRQNEMLRAQEQEQFMQHQQHHHQNMVFDHDHHHRLHHHHHHHYHGPNNGDNYMIHPHMIGAASYGRII